MGSRMGWIERVRRRAVGLLRRMGLVTGAAEGEFQRDLSAELRHHIELEAEDLVRRGWDPDDARREAFRRFGGEERTRERIREELGGRWLGDLVQDLRVGWRKLGSQPGFTIVAVVTLALGIGANTAIFSVIDSVLLRPLPYPESDRLVSVWEVTPEGNDRNVVTRGNFMDWRDQATVFEELGAYGLPASWSFVDDAGRPSRIRGARWSPGTFRVLDVAAEIGRTFTSEEGVPGNDAVVVLSHGFWERTFGADANVLGQTLNLDDERFRVVGVMPDGFRLPSEGAVAEADFWVPWALGEQDRQNRRSHNLRVIGRLEPGASVDRAQGELDRIAARIAELHPTYMEGWGVNVRPFRDDLVASSRSLLILLLGVSAVVLLLACANLANLLLTRAVGRQREVALRGALGAGRSRILRQFLTEAGLLAFLGGTLGLAVTVAGLDVFLALAPEDVPLLQHASVNGPVLGFSVGTTLLATLLFGLLPALKGTATDLRSTFRASDDRITGGSHARIRSGILVTQVALAVALLIGAGLLVRSFVALQGQDYGFDRSGLFTAALDLPTARYPDGTPDHVRFYGELLERTESLPGVVRAAGSTDLPAGYGSMTFSFAIEGRPTGGANPRETPQPLRIVTPGYFRTLGVPVLDGRVFTDADDQEGLPVLVVNEALKRLHWPDASPVGQRISFEGPEGPWWEIVGVVGDTRHYAMDAAPSPAVFMPHAQKPWDWANWLNVIARTEGDPLALGPSFRAALGELDDQILPTRVARLSDLYAETNERRTFAMALMGAFAAVAVVLGTIGVHGVLAFGVARRSREFGVRIALGADRAAIAASVVGRGVRLALLGIAVGLASAFVLSRFLEGLVYGVAVRDPLTFAGVPLLFLGVAALAAYLPARRATRVDPMVSLRAE